MIVSLIGWDRQERNISRSLLTFYFYFWLENISWKIILRVLTVIESFWSFLKLKCSHYLSEKGKTSYTKIWGHARKQIDWFKIRYSDLTGPLKTIIQASFCFSSPHPPLLDCYFSADPWSSMADLVLKLETPTCPSCT